MSVMHEMTVDFLKTRKQFGVPIGNFQVLQHRAAEMLIALEQARSMAMLAAITAEDVRVARDLLARAARRAGMPRPPECPWSG